MNTETERAYKRALLCHGYNASLRSHLKGRCPLVVRALNLNTISSTGSFLYQNNTLKVLVHKTFIFVIKERKSNGAFFVFFFF